MTRTLRCLALLAAVACTATDDESPDDTDTDTDTDVDSDSDTDLSFPRADWMAETFAGHEDAELGHILIPGAFNASSYACAVEYGMSPDAPEFVRLFWGDDDAPGDPEMRERMVAWSKMQERPIGRQLRDGIRFVSINVTLREGVVTTWHSVYGVPVTDVIEQVVDFSVAHPDEVVLLTLGLTLDEADWPQLADALTAPHTDGVSLCDLVYDGEDNAARATLAEIRASGRPLVWAPSGEFRAFLDARGDCPTSTAVLDRHWSVTIEPEGVETTIAETVDARNPDNFLIHDHVFSLGGTESVIEQGTFIADYFGMAEVHRELGFQGDFPARLIEDYDGEGNMNVFVGAFYEDSTLIEAAIARNVERLAE